MRDFIWISMAFDLKSEISPEIKRAQYINIEN